MGDLDYRTKKRGQEIMAFARVCADALGVYPEGKTPNACVLEAATVKEFARAADAYTRQAQIAAADGILDVQELFSLCILGGKALDALSRALSNAAHFYLSGDLVAEADGNVYLCYAKEGRGACRRSGIEACTICPRRECRIVPAAFFHSLKDFSRESGLFSPVETPVAPRIDSTLASTSSWGTAPRQAQRA